VAVPDGSTGAWPEGTWLGFDFGLRRIGVAVGQTATRTASPLVVVRHGDREPDWPHLNRLLDEWRPVGIVVGLPLGPEGEATPMSKRARAFGERLAGQGPLPVAWCDERLSSRDAERRFAANRAAGSARRRDAAQLDAMAAAIILENWLQSLPHEH
jgi:putative Holliday junction resolvase